MLTHQLSALEKKGFNILFTSQVKNFPPALLTYFTEEEKKKSLILLGSGGKILWNKIPEKNSAHPFDSYSIVTMKWLIEAAKLENAEIIFPHNERLLPLQQLGRHFAFTAQSPIGLDISHEFGLWFAYRGVILTDTVLASNHQLIAEPFACDYCKSRPCISAPNISSGRLLCPYKTEHQYTKEQQDYHLAALERLNL